MNNREEQEIQHFNALASEYDANYGYTDQFTQYKIDQRCLLCKRLQKRFMKKSPATILDLGCGTGEYTYRLAQLYPDAKIIGLDISSKILDIARRKCKEYPQISFMETSAYKTSLPDHSIDMVTGFYVLHHLDYEKTALELKRVIATHGLIFFAEPNILNPLVFMLKSVPLFKQWVGDSPDETAINPLSITHAMKFFKLLFKQTGEFFPRSLPISEKSKIELEQMSSWLQHIPGLNLTGSSTYLLFTPKRSS